MKKINFKSVAQLFEAQVQRGNTGGDQTANKQIKIGVKPTNVTCNSIGLGNRSRSEDGKLDQPGGDYQEMGQEQLGLNQNTEIDFSRQFDPEEDT